MKTYTFWNNKGGTGKTSLCFQTAVQYALDHSDKSILIIDLCPQANLSEYLLGGMLGNGSQNLESLWINPNGRCSIAGYFYDHIPSAHTMFSGFNSQNYICVPHQYNPNVPNNISLVAGDSYVEQLTNSISALSSMVIPNGSAYIKVVSWMKDFLASIEENNTYDLVFIDTNPSFSIYTQMAIAAANELIIPVTADSSSLRALNNVLALVYGINPNANNIQNTFYVQMVNANMPLPIINSIIRNRLTQYMGPASAYSAVLSSITNLSQNLQIQYPQYFAQNFQIIDVRDFNTVGQIAFAESKVFSQINAGFHYIGRRKIQANPHYISDCITAMQPIIDNL